MLETPLRAKLEGMSARHDELERLLADPTLLSAPDRYQQVAREHAAASEVVVLYRELLRVRQEAEDAGVMARGEQDPEMRDLAVQEGARLAQAAAALEGRLREALMPADPHAERDIIMEVRAGTGGEEAALFAGDLYRMYARYAERRRWKTEVLESNPTGLGGFKEIIFAVKGKGAYSRLRFESGVHRVQRVPVTAFEGAARRERLRQHDQLRIQQLQPLHHRHAGRLRFLTQS